MTKPTKLDMLTESQRSIVFATVMSDGWIEKGKNNINARLGFQQSLVNRNYFDSWRNSLTDWITGDSKIVYRTPPGSTQKFGQISVRTIHHPQFTFFYDEFRPGNDSRKRKIIPRYDFLIEYLNYEAFAHILMQDGSSKSDESKGMEIHYQSYTKTELIRLCIAIYNKLKIKATVSSYNSGESDKKQYTIYISGDSYDIIKNQVYPLMHPDMQYKVPTERTELGKIRQQSQPNNQSNWTTFYEEFQNSECLKNIDFIIQEDL
jgi:hypothetical protein